MKKLSPLIILSTLLLSGCGVFGGGSSNNQTNNTPTPPPQPTPEEKNQGQTPEETVTETENVGRNTMPNALIPSTNPQERLSQINQGRSNPFSSIRPPVLVRIPATEPVPVSTVATKAILREPLPVLTEKSADIQVNEVNNRNNITEVNNRNNITTNNVASGGVGRKNNNPPALNPNGQKLPENTNLIPDAPPEPKEAQSVVINGIADLQGQNIAFITTPWDNTTHRVRVGDTLFSQDSGVSIRVREIRFTYPKTIALKDDEQIIYRNLYEPNGIVVLEQYGQRVTKEILGNSNTSKESKG